MRAEVISQKIFQEAELPCPKMNLVRFDGELAILIEFLEGYHENEEDHCNTLPEIFENHPILQLGFFLDLLTYNYDRTPWNLMYKGSEFMFIDFGASLLSRAQGGTKGFPKTVTEDQYNSVWKHNPQFMGPTNKAYANLMGKPGAPMMKEALATLAKITDQVIDRIVSEVYEISGDTIWTQEENACSENRSYASHSATVKEIIEDGGSERSYIKDALRARRISIFERMRQYQNLR
jgi:hypothetical protein